MRVLRVAISPLLAAWLVLLAGIGPAHCLLRIQAVQGLCAPATAVQPDEPSGHGRQAADAVCLVCASLPAMPPPDDPALAGPLRHAAPLPETAPQRRDVPARQAALPPARAPPNAA
jgi:hypothetical protein